VYAFGGFDSPVSATGVVDGAKAGEPLPLKFSLQGNHGTGVVARVTSQPVACADWSSLGAAAVGQGTLDYSASTDRYTELVATDAKWKGTCRAFDVQLDDGTHHSVNVRFK
jgi:hypothetical protein